MTVIASVKLDYVRATGRCACESDRSEAGFSSRRNQSYFFCTCDRRRDQFRKLDFQARRCAETEAQPRLLRYRLCDVRMSVSENCGPVGSNVIEKSVAVGVDQCCTAA